MIAATVYFTDGGNLMSLMASSSSDEPSKIIGDANKDFINFDGEKENSETIDYNDELKTERHLSAGVFPSLFGSDYNDLNQSDESEYSDTEEGNFFIVKCQMFSLIEGSFQLEKQITHFISL